MFFWIASALTLNCETRPAQLSFKENLQRPSSIERCLYSIQRIYCRLLASLLQKSINSASKIIWHLYLHSIAFLSIWIRSKVSLIIEISRLSIITIKNIVVIIKNRNPIGLSMSKLSLKSAKISRYDIFIDSYMLEFSIYKSFSSNSCEIRRKVTEKTRLEVSKMHKNPSISLKTASIIPTRYLVLPKSLNVDREPRVRMMNTAKMWIRLTP